ncbi:hypothetical protein HK405_014154, partial [Cladochytrium tenue]
PTTRPAPPTQLSHRSGLTCRRLPEAAGRSLAAVQVGDAVFATTDGSERTTAIFDTGAAFGLLLPDVLDALAATIPSAKKTPLPARRPSSSPPPAAGTNYVCVVDCIATGARDAPTLSLVLPGGESLQLSASEYVVRVALETCVVGFLPDKAGLLRGGSLLLGNTFLKRFYTVFDTGAARIGFALATADGPYDISCYMRPRGGCDSRTFFAVRDPPTSARLVA